MTDQQTNYFPALTGFRAMAAFMVFFHHANPFAPMGRWLPYAVLNELYIGVSFFFVLSGFLIYWRYHDLFANNKGGFRVYIQNRFARIYPLYFFLTCFTFIVLFSADKLKVNGESVFMIISNFTLIKGFFNELKFTGIAPAWSLTVEECFYLLAPLIFFWWNKLGMLMPLLIIITGILLVAVFQNCDFYGLFSNLNFMMVYTFFGRCFEFFAGVALARYVKSQPVNRFRFATYFGVGGIILILAGLVAIRGDAKYGLDRPTGIVLNNFILPLMVAVFIYGLITQRTIIQRALSSSVLQLLGKSSYAFYLLHDGIFFSAIYRYVSQNTLIIFLTINVLAVVCFYLIEKPLQERWKSVSVVF